MIEETDNYKRKNFIIQIIFLILMASAISGLIISIGTIWKYKEMLMNPVGYNIDKFGLQYCTCYDNTMKIVPIKGLKYNNSYEQFLPQQEIYNPYK